MIVFIFSYSFFLEKDFVKELNECSEDDLEQKVDDNREPRTKSNQENLRENKKYDALNIFKKKIKN